MRIVIALGGNALLQRGQPMTAENQRANIRVAAADRPPCRQVPWLLNHMIVRR
jgi:carbamate kinase